MSNKSRKTRKHGRTAAIVLSIVLLVAGTTAIVIPIVEENHTLSRDAAEYQELAEELKSEEQYPEVPTEEMPHTADPHENDDSDQNHVVIHPPDLTETPAQATTSEAPMDATVFPSVTDSGEVPTQLPNTLLATKAPTAPRVTSAPNLGVQSPTVSSAPNTVHATAAPTPETTEAPKPPPPTPRPGNTGANLEACLAKNSEFIAWLKIPGTNVDYPVVLSDNVDFYLDHSFTGTQSKLGTLFSLGKTDYKTPGRNIAIYGHHITNTSGGQKMFRPLLSYKQRSFWEKHQTIYLDSRYHIGVYRVFAVIDMVSGDWDPSRASFSSDADFLRFVSKAREQSLYETGIEVGAGDHILTLITCDRSFADKAGRLVVMAVEVPE